MAVGKCNWCKFCVCIQYYKIILIYCITFILLQNNTIFSYSYLHFAVLLHPYFFKKMLLGKGTPTSASLWIFFLRISTQQVGHFFPQTPDGMWILTVFVGKPSPIAEALTALGYIHWGHLRYHTPPQSPASSQTMWFLLTVPALLQYEDCVHKIMSSWTSQNSLYGARSFTCMKRI
jgi:hypothetical protein